MSTSDPRSVGGAITLDQLIALNDEMATLVRAGVPLERGLIRAGNEIGGRSGRVALAIGERLERGERLEDALAGSGHRFPTIYQAVVEAGLRSGQLARALEGLSSMARSYAEARRSIGMALLYPLLVILLAYAFFLAFVVWLAPRFAMAVESMGLDPIRPLTVLAELERTIPYWGPVLPVILLLLYFRWFLFGRATALDGGVVGTFATRTPVLGPMLRDFRSANFSDLLALLVDHQVPLDEAVRLAGQASGNRRLEKTTDELASRLRSGDPLEVFNATDQGAFPPMLAWLLGSGYRQASLAEGLRQVGQNYRRNARSKARFLQAVLPTVLMVTIGGGSVIAYAMVLFLPLKSFWNELSLPTR